MLSIILIAIDTEITFVCDISYSSIKAVKSLDYLITMKNLNSK